MSLLLMFPPPAEIAALVPNSDSNNVTPLTFAGGVWTAGTAVAVGAGPYLGVVIYSQ